MLYIEAPNPDSVVTEGNGRELMNGEGIGKVGWVLFSGEKKNAHGAALVMKGRSSLNFLAAEFWGLEVGLDDKEKPT